MGNLGSGSPVPARISLPGPSDLPCLSVTVDGQRGILCENTNKRSKLCNIWGNDFQRGHGQRKGPLVPQRSVSLGLHLQPLPATNSEKQKLVSDILASTRSRFLVRKGAATVTSEWLATLVFPNGI